jgi:ABC-type antimicrobial peptide transport system permease subunit
MTEILSHSLAQRRFTMALLSAFGALALLLAAVGIYGVMSYMVAQRTGEIGIRMALGAQKRDILELVSRDGMLRTGFGLLAGLLVSLALARVLTSQLFTVSALDPLTFGEVLLCWRASRCWRAMCPREGRRALIPWPLSATSERSGFQFSVSVLVFGPFVPGTKVFSF